MPESILTQLLDRMDKISDTINGMARDIGSLLAKMDTTKDTLNDHETKLQDVHQRLDMHSEILTDHSNFVILLKAMFRYGAIGLLVITVMAIIYHFDGRAAVFQFIGNVL